VARAPGKGKAAIRPALPLDHIEMSHLMERIMVPMD